MSHAKEHSAALSDQRRAELLEELAETIDAGLALAPHWYTDPGIHAFERDEIFRRTWQYVGHTAQVSRPGDYFTTEIGGIPLVVVRDQDETRAFVNICRHRSHRVAKDAGNRSTLQCAYHAWTYDLDGTLRAAPRCEREPDFDLSAYPLLPMRLDTWGQLIFVNPDPDAAPLAEQLGELPALLESRGHDLNAFVPRATRQYETKCNWKLIVDNMIECYHCSVAHPSFKKYYHVGPERYSIEKHDYFCYQYGPLRDFEEAQALKDSWGDFELVWVWPNLLMIISPASFVVGPMRPVTVDSSTLGFEAFFRPDADEQAVQDYVEYYEEILAEDAELVAAVQRGHDAGVLPRGPLLLDSEDMLRHLQVLIRRVLEQGAGVPL
jgi:phenylpropionate dioxygenase-like ring-hydroxylating dioxygenase large terminal subunit